MGTRCAQGVRISMAMTLAATATPIGASQALSPPQPGAGSGLVTVQRVVDGDTLDVVRDGRHVRVRLLNINTPETVDPNRAAECGGPDASDWLRQRLPAGSAITLTHDVELLDRYGRELALVTAADGGVVNVEIARNGLGEAVRYEPNQRFYPQVLAAQEQARSTGSGLFDPAMPCTLAASVQTQISALTAGAASTAGGTQSVGAAPVSALDGALAASPRVWLSLLFGAMTVNGRLLGEAGRARLATTYMQASAEAPTLRNRLRARIARAEQPGSERSAGSREDSTTAPRARRTATPPPGEKRSTAPKKRSSTTGPTKRATNPPAPEPPGESSGKDPNPSGYTGKRCYAPGGKTWRPC